MNEAERQWLEDHDFGLDIEYCKWFNRMRYYTIPEVKTPYRAYPTMPLYDQPFFVTVTKYEPNPELHFLPTFTVKFHVVTPSTEYFDIHYQLRGMPRKERVFLYAMPYLNNEGWKRAVFRWNIEAEKKYSDGYYMMEEPI